MSVSTEYPRTRQTRPRFDTLASRVVRWRWTVTLIVFLAPLCGYLLYPNTMFPLAHDVDPWLYISWARHFDYVTDRWYFTYYFVRFPLTFPGHLLYSALPDEPAKVLWGLMFAFIFLGSMAGIFRRLFGPAYGLLGLIFVATDVLMLGRMGSGYVDGPACAYLSATFYFVLCAADATWRTRPPGDLVERDISLGQKCRVVIGYGSFFLAGLLFGLTLLTYLNPAMWAVPLSVVFLLRCDRSKYAAIGAGVLLVGAGLAIAVLGEIAIFHHYTGRMDFWKAPLDFAKIDQSAYALPLADFVHGYLHTAAWPHLMPATVTSLLSLGVCIHALRHRVSFRDPAVLANLLYVLVIGMLLAFQLNGTVGITVFYFFTYAFIAQAVALVGFVIYAQRYLGQGSILYAVIVAGGFLVWWPLHTLWPDADVWYGVQSVTDHDNGVFFLAAGLVAMVVIQLVRSPGTASAVLRRRLPTSPPSSCCAVVCARSKAGRCCARTISTAVRSTSLPRRPPISLYRVIRMALRPSSLPQLDDGDQGRLAGALNANFMYEYSQVTRAWSNARCIFAKAQTDFVVAGGHGCWSREEFNLCANAA